MAIYRFKIYLEDNEDVYRDIDIRASQTFEDLHDAIQSAFKFDSKHAASFFVSDDYWRKGQEITLRKEDLPLDEEEIRQQVDPKRLMKETKIAKYIEQPHQRFVYVFDPAVQWTFLIEMMRITEESPKTSYPSISRSVGTPPKQYKQILPVKEEVAAGADPLAEGAPLEDEEEEDDIPHIETGEEAVEEEDINALEGEEGEEEPEDIEGESTEEADGFDYESGED